jgi:hypothetical protein
VPSREATAGALACTGGDAEDERREQRLAARQRVGRGHSSGARRMVSRERPVRLHRATSRKDKSRLARMYLAAEGRR